MKIILNNLGKKFNKEWIFKNFDGEYNLNDKTVILGSNGSGKSTFLKVLSGFYLPNEGEITFTNSQKDIVLENIYQYIAFTSPYIGIYEDYTIPELFSFYSSLKPMYQEINIESFLKIIDLEKVKNKEIKYFSSGMKQRVKLGLSILTQSPILLLDEPTINLDERAIEWYKELIVTYSNDRILFIASNNQKNEYFICDKQVQIEKFKS